MHLSMKPIRNIKLRYRYFLKVLPKFAQCQKKIFMLMETYYPCRLLKD